jgi:signal peptidase
MTGDDSSVRSSSRLFSIPWRRLANGVGLVLLLAVLIPFVVFAVPQAVGADQSYVVTSGSMEPNISVASAIIVEEVDTAQIEENDIITFGSDEQTTTHRVIEVVDRDGQRVFRTKGDNNEDPDPSLVTSDTIEGRVMTVAGEPATIPYVGYVVQFTKTQTGFVTMVLVPFVLLVLNEVWNVVASATPGPDTDDGAGEESTGRRGVTEPTEEPDVVSADATATDAASADDSVETDDDGTITLFARELQLGIAAAGAFLAYSVWVSYVTMEFWAFATTAGVVTAFLLLSGLYLTGRSDGEGATSGPESVPELQPEAEPESDSESGVADAVTTSISEASANSEKKRREATSDTSGTGFLFLDDPIATDDDGAAVDSSTEHERDSVFHEDRPVAFDHVVADGRVSFVDGEKQTEA